MKHNYATVNKVSLHYICGGEGELILFLHGFPEFWYEWKNQLFEFSKSHFVVSPDMRGYNLSTKPEKLDQYQMKFLVEDIRQLVEYLGYKKFILVGHDWGGIVAWSFALAHPDYLNKLIIINAPHPAIFARELNLNPAQQQASQYVKMFQSSEAESKLSDNNYELLFSQTLKKITPSEILTEEDKNAYIQSWSQPRALTGALNYYRTQEVKLPTAKEPVINLFGSNLNNLMIQVPTLVIWGEKDTALLTSNLDGLEQFVTNLTIKRIPDGSHWVIHEKPDMINSYIHEFIES